MSPALKKVTIELPEELLEKAQQATGSGITQTIRTGLQLVAASQAYADLRQARGKFHFSQTFAELKDDR
jgi:Arc/MetJ-type ribon-helix-helix transcriptional regulator